MKLTYYPQHIKHYPTVKEEPLPDQDAYRDVPGNQHDSPEQLHRQVPGAGASAPRHLFDQLVLCGGQEEGGGRGEGGAHCARPDHPIIIHLAER